MQVEKWGNSLAARLPAVAVEALQLKEGDEIEVDIGAERHLLVARDPSREQALAMTRPGAAFAVGLPLQPRRGERAPPVSGVFFNSNVLLYTLAAGDPRGPIDASLLAKGGAICVQVLTQVANVARRKLRLSGPRRPTWWRPYASFAPPRCR